MAGGAHVRVVDRDRGWRSLAREVERLKRGAFVRVGVQGNEAAAAHQNGNGKTVADVATTHEFGAVVVSKNGKQIVIPERSFIRATIDLNHAKLQRTATLLGRGVIAGRFARGQALELLGEQAVGMMKQRISDGIAPANAPATIARKGSSTPLIDQGQLRGSLTQRAES